MTIFITTFAKTISSNNYDIETLAIEIESNRCKNNILNVIHRQPHGNVKVSENYFNDFFSKKGKKSLEDNTCRRLEY